MQKLFKGWLSCWLYVITAVAGVILGLLIANWDAWDWGTKLYALGSILLPIHVLEEWHFPGGFHVMYNRMVDSDMPDKYPMNQLSDMWTNFIGVMFGCIVLIVGVKPMFLIMQLFLCLMEVLGHIVNGGQFMRKNYGKFYNPGMATTILGYIPIGVGIFVFFFAVQMPTLWDVLLGLTCGLGLGAFALKGCEELCKDKNTPYGYDWGDGYFAKFYTEKTK